MTHKLEVVPAAPARSAGLTARALAVGLLLVVGFTVAGCFCVLLRYEIIGTGYLPRGAVCLLLALIAGNAVLRPLRRLHKRLSLSARELLLVFALLLVVGAVAGQEYAQHVYLNLLGVVYYTTPDIAPPELYLEDLNPMLVPATDREAPAVRWAFEGLPPGRSLPWRAWLVPLLVWTPFFFALYWMLLCCAALLAHRWEREEKLLYPLVQVPLEMAEAEPAAVAPLFRSRLMWGTFGFACLLYTMKGVHAYWPAVPDLNLQKTTQTVLTGPYAAFNYVPYHLYPEMVGIAYLLTSEVGLSLWAFYWFRRIEEFVRIAVGIDVGHYNFYKFQTVGGYVVLAVALLWSARAHLRRALAVALGMLRRDPEAPDADEPYGVAVFGFVAALVFVIAWCVHFGMGTVWALLQYGFLPLVGVVVARVICEAGMYIYTSPFRLNEAIFEIAGTERMDPMSITLMTMTGWAQIRSTATLNMAAAAQSLKIGADMGAKRLHVMLAAMAAIVVAILTSHVTSLYVIYHWGVPKLGWWPSGSSLNTTTTLARYLRVPTTMPVGNWVGVATGAALTWGLVVLRRRFVWWPLHPLGFVAFLGWPIDRYWMSIFLGWLIKATVVRLGGYKAFSRLRAGAFGLVLGVCVIITFSIIVHFIYPAPSLIVE